MTDSRAEPDVVPMVSYENCAAALRWLTAAFGFAEVARIEGADGRVEHAELATGGSGRIMLGTPSPAYQSPRRHREHCAPAAEWSRPPHVVDGVLVRVPDADASCERARAAGAVILREPADEPPGRLYVAEDLEGHRWMFLQP